MHAYTSRNAMRSCVHALCPVFAVAADLSPEKQAKVLGIPEADLSSMGFTDVTDAYGEDAALLGAPVQVAQYAFDAAAGIYTGYGAHDTAVAAAEAVLPSEDEVNGAPATNVVVYSSAADTSAAAAFVAPGTYATWGAAPVTTAAMAHTPAAWPMLYAVDPTTGAYTAVAATTAAYPAMPAQQLAFAPPADMLALMAPAPMPVHAPPTTLTYGAPLAAAPAPAPEHDDDVDLDQLLALCTMDG